MFRTIEDLMYINDGIKPYGNGLGYKPSLPISGGTINNDNKKFEEDTTKFIDENNSLKKLQKLYDKLLKGEEVINERNDEDDKNIDLSLLNKLEQKINEKLKVITKPPEKKDMTPEPIEEENIDAKFMELLHNIDNLDINELIELGNLATEFNFDGKITDEELQIIEDKIRDKEISIKNLKPIRRKELGRNYKDEIGFKLELDNDKQIKTEITKGSTDAFLNTLMDNFIENKSGIGDFGKRFEEVWIDTNEKFGNKYINNDKHPFYSKFKQMFNGDLKPISDFLPYDTEKIGKDGKPIETDELKCYIDDKTIDWMEKTKKETGIDGVPVQLSKFKTDRYTPFFNIDDNDNVMLENIYDNYYNSNSDKKSQYSNKYVNSGGMRKLNMKYLLPDGLYKLDLTDGDIFDFKPAVITEYNKIFPPGGKPINTTVKKTYNNNIYIYDIDNIKKKFPFIKDYKGKEIIWVDKKYLSKISK